MMKRTIIAIVAALGLVAGTSQNALAQVEEGTFIIDPYYGFPNFGKGLLGGTGIQESLEAGLNSADGISDAKFTGIGPCGLRLEYMLADNFGIGIDAIYNSVGIKGNYLDSLGVNQYEASAKMQRLRIQLRLNYHFAQTEKLDAYVGGGAGSNTRFWSAKTNEPGYDNVSEPAQLLPVSVRLALGMRYYFHPNIGINAELGIGGPVLSGGVSVKF